MTDDEGGKRDDEGGKRDDEGGERDDEGGERDDDVDDPFDELGEGLGESDAVNPEPMGSESTGPEPARDDPADGLTDESVDDPFDELGPATGDAGDDLGEAFERMDVGEVAEEAVWESIDEDAAGDRFSPGAAERSDARSDEVEHVVDKRTYCQQCPHFSAPPDVACTHEGTTIVEAVGFDEFRVRNCPMVSEEDPTFDAER